MTVYRPTYQAVLPPDAHGTTKKGRKAARFRITKSGRIVEGPVTPDELKATVPTDVYFCRIKRNGRTQRVSTGVTDKGSSRPGHGPTPTRSPVM
jgi:hypothetical protein